jgi:hypothetical protein
MKVMDEFINKDLLLDYLRNPDKLSSVNMLNIETGIFAIQFSDEVDEDWYSEELEELNLDSNESSVIKIEIGFGHDDIDGDSDLDELMRAEQCKELEKIVGRIILQSGYFYSYSDMGMCPGSSFSYYTFTDEKRLDKIADILNEFLKEGYAIENLFTEGYFKNNYYFGKILDKVRIVNINTQTRYIPLLGKILKEISIELRPLSIIKLRVHNWSKLQFEKDVKYRNSAGILHKYDSENNIVETTAFSHYISLLDSIGLITRVNNFVRCTKLGILYLKLLDNQNNNENYDCEVTKIFFQYWFLNYDADGILAIIQAVKGDYNWLISITNSSHSDNLVTDSYLRNNINRILEYRFIEKSKYSNSTTKLSIENKLSEIKKDAILNKQTKTNSSAPAKHFIPPRLAWLVYWNLIAIEKNKYKLTEEGIFFYESLPKLPISIAKDITDRWIQNRLFRLLPKLNNLKTEDFDKLDAKDQDEKLSILLSELYEWQNDGALRLSYYTSYLYICFRCLLEGITVTFLCLTRNL